MRSVVGESIMEHKNMFVQRKFTGADVKNKRIVNKLCRLFKVGSTNSHFDERSVRSSVVIIC